MLALLVLALARSTVAYYDGPRGYCSPFTARYLTLIDDVLVFHGGHRQLSHHAHDETDLTARSTSPSVGC